MQIDIIIFDEPSTSQLVIKDAIFSMASVKTLIDKCHTLVAHANMSNAFYKEFYDQQKRLGIMNQRSLKRDVDTRYQNI